MLIHRRTQRLSARLIPREGDITRFKRTYPGEFRTRY